MHIFLSNLRQEMIKAIFDLVEWGHDKLPLDERKLYRRVVI
jgi:hypothetical protein